MKPCKTICNKFQQNLIRKVWTNLDCNFRHAFGEVWAKFKTAGRRYTQMDYRGHCS